MSEDLKSKVIDTIDSLIPKGQNSLVGMLKMKTRRKIIPGERFGRLVVIKKDGVHIKPCGTKQSKYLCICDCGKYTSVLGQNLISGNTKSCGCLSREIKKEKLLPYNKGVINHIILQYKRHARNRGFDWHLNTRRIQTGLIKGCCNTGSRTGRSLRQKPEDLGRIYLIRLRR